MENLTKIVNYIQEIVNPDSSNEMSSPPSTSSGCISGTSEDDHVDHLEKAIDSFCNVSAETYLTLPEVKILFLGPHMLYLVPSDLYHNSRKFYH